MDKTPNLLLIWTDQQRTDTMRCYGNEFVNSPNFDRLADKSFVFRNPYCAQPVCTPSRGTIMSGLWPHAHGAYTNNIPLLPEVKSVAEMVSPEYRRVYYGKWHLGDENTPQHGFEEWKGIEDYYRKHYSQPEYLEVFSSYHHYLIKNGYTPDSEAEDGARVFSREFAAALAEPYTKSAFLGQEAADFLREQDGSRPFLLNVNFLEPHPPIFGPLNNHYDPDALPLPSTFMQAPEPDIQSRVLERAEEFRTVGMKGYPLEKTWDWQRLRANYFGLVTMVDNALGKILDALEESGQADNTIIAFTSDHGEMLGDHTLFKKGIFYEEAVKVPLLIHVPWLSKEQKMIEGRISLIDLVPTLLDLMGQPVGDHLHGQSRKAVLEGSDTLEDNAVFIQWNDRKHTGQEGRVIITPDNWKLCLFRDDNNMLFDLNSDPHELKNLYHEPDQKARISEMAALIRNWQGEIDDSVSLKE